MSIWSGLGDLKIEIQGRQCQPPPHIVDYHVIWLGSAVSYLHNGVKVSMKSHLNLNDSTISEMFTIVSLN